MITTCVLREVAPGQSEYVPVSEVPFVSPSDKLFSGDFRLESGNYGPSRSHKRTICLPTGTLTVSQPCVLRDLGDGTGKQFVPTNEVPSIEKGETLFVGAFRSQKEKHGPYGSHTRTVCVPVGKPVEVRAA